LFGHLRYSSPSLALEVVWDLITLDILKNPNVLFFIAGQPVIREHYPAT
jgi:hypothetical protein